MNLTDVVAHGLGWGLVLSLYLASAFVGLLRLNAEMWLEDYPPDVRRAFGPMSDEVRRMRFRLGTPVLAGALALVAFATADFAGAASATTFLPVAVHTFVVLMTFNLVDLLVIDWLLFVRIQPPWVVLPGTEGLAGYSSYRFHVRGLVKGTIGIAAASVGVGGLTTVA